MIQQYSPEAVGNQTVENLIYWGAIIFIFLLEILLIRKSLKKPIKSGNAPKELATLINQAERRIFTNQGILCFSHENHTTVNLLDHTALLQCTLDDRVERSQEDTRLGNRVDSSTYSYKYLIPKASN